MIMDFVNFQLKNLTHGYILYKFMVVKIHQLKFQDVQIQKLVIIIKMQFMMMEVVHLIYQLLVVQEMEEIVQEFVEEKLKQMFVVYVFVIKIIIVLVLYVHQLLLVKQEKVVIFMDQVVRVKNMLYLNYLILIVLLVKNFKQDLIIMVVQQVLG